MSASEWATIIVATATLVSSLAGLVAAIRTGRQVDRTHQLVDGQSGQLRTALEAKGFAEGINQGIDQERPQAPY